MRPDMQGFDLLDDGALREITGYLTARDLVWLSHASEPVGHVYPGKGSVTPEALYPFILRYQELNIVLAHWGGGLPFYALMPEVKAALSNVFFDTAASPYLYDRAVYGQAAENVGEARIMFGSDYPLLSPARLLKEIESTTLTAEAKKAITGENARRVYNFIEEGKT